MSVCLKMLINSASRHFALKQNRMVLFGFLFMILIDISLVHRSSKVDYIKASGYHFFFLAHLSR